MAMILSMPVVNSSKIFVMPDRNGSEARLVTASISTTFPGYSTKNSSVSFTAYLFWVSRDTSFPRNRNRI